MLQSVADRNTVRVEHKTANSNRIITSICRFVLNLDYVCYFMVLVLREFVLCPRDSIRRDCFSLIRNEGATTYGQTYIRSDTTRVRTFELVMRKLLLY